MHLRYGRSTFSLLLEVRTQRTKVTTARGANQKIFSSLQLLGVGMSYLLLHYSLQGVHLAEEAVGTCFHPCD